tara:strand:+ start:4165 stop:5382 length:1218 start_codon:yes stop_codon:yes gene_type:complete
MKSFKLSNHPDVIMVYQDRDTVEPAIQQIMELDLKFKAYQYNPKQMHAIAEMEPKVLLLSSNNVKNTIQFYIDYLEEYEQKIAPHSAVLLINNRETFRAYLACENGLFDNYVIINPLNEPYRLKLVLLQELHIVETHKNNSLELLISEGEDQLASCIEHGVALKRSFIQKVNQCEEKVISATGDALKNMEGIEAKTVLQNLIGLSFGEVNENISADIQKILEQLNVLKLNNQSIKQGVEKQKTPNKKTMVSVNNVVKNPVEVLSHDKTSDKVQIQWNTGYSVGNKYMDDQHKELFIMINEFFQQDNKKDAISLFENLSSYIDLHFESEENLLRQINYSFTDKHIKEHDELRHNFNALRKRLDNYDIDIQHKIGMFLYNWMAKHILKSDMEYKAYALLIEEESFSQ